MASGRSTPPSSPLLADDAQLADFRLRDSASHLLRRAHFRAENLFSERLAPLGITARQKAILITIHQNPGAMLSEVADNVVLERQTAAEIVDRLVTRRLVSKGRSSRDRRAYALALTPDGLEVLRTAISYDAEVEHDILGALPEAERERFIELLRLMTQAPDGELRAVDPT